jgi:hypothetical protein
LSHEDSRRFLDLKSVESNEAKNVQMHIAEL